MAYAITTPIQGQNLSASLYGKAVKDAINDLDTRMNEVEVLANARINKVSQVADSATYTTTEVSINTITASLVIGWTYRVSVFTSVSASTIASPSIEQTLLRLRQDTLVGGLQMQAAQVYIGGTSSVGFFAQISAEHTAVATGSKTFHLTAIRTSGGGNHQIRANGGAPTFLFVDLVVIP